jgi:predicted TIM-barrel fold metal-dependent hydrolase
MDIKTAPAHEHTESIIDPSLPIVDTHHHLWDGSEGRYLFDDFLSDIQTGHNIVHTVFVECQSMFRRRGPEHLRPVGEAEFVSGMAAMSESGRYGSTGICSGFVGFVDLRWGDLVEEALDALMLASGQRLRGIRQAARWQTEELPGLPAHKNPRDLLSDARFRSGFTKLAKHNLAYDAWQLHMQLPQLAELVRAFADTTIVINHIGGPVGTGSYRDKRKEVFENWSSSMRELARCESVYVKLGGLGMPYMGFGFERSAKPATSAELAQAWAPYIETCIEIFGPGRCMFESNFPVDRVSGSYSVFWNAFKRITARYSPAERTALFSGTASKVYRLPPLGD